MFGSEENNIYNDIGSGLTYVGDDLGRGVGDVGEGIGIENMGDGEGEDQISDFSIFDRLFEINDDQ